MADERIVVIGSNSFSGSHFAACALQEGGEVIGMSRSPEPSDVFLPYKWISHDRFHFRQCDLNEDLEKIMNIIVDFQPDYIVNFAAQSMVGQSWTSPEDWFMTNTVSMIKLHDRLRKCSFLKKYIHISTPEVYGATNGIVREDAPYNPSTPYAVSKAACDMSLMTFFRTYRFPVIFTRAANVCGPGQQSYRIIPKTILAIQQGKKIKLEGDGSAVRSFIHIRDVCKGTLKAARWGQPGEIYHLSSGKSLTIHELVKLICKLMDVHFDDYVETGPARLGQDAAYLLDSTKARVELNWCPAIDLEKTILETIDWVQKNMDEIVKHPSEYIHRT